MDDASKVIQNAIDCNDDGFSHLSKAKGKIQNKFQVDSFDKQTSSHVPFNVIDLKNLKANEPQQNCKIMESNNFLNHNVEQILPFSNMSHNDEEIILNFKVETDSNDPSVTVESINIDNVHRDESNNIIWQIENSVLKDRVHSEENINNSDVVKNKDDDDEFCLNFGTTRRNSLPEISTIAAFNKDVKVVKDDDNLPLVKSKVDSYDGKSKGDIGSGVKYNNFDQKNLSGVVKNFQGIFSLVGGSLKNAMEKKSGVMLATQKNFKIVKNDYFKFYKDGYNMQKMTDNINKYNSLKLSSDVCKSDDEIFKKCEKFSPTVDETTVGIGSVENCFNKTSSVETKTRNMNSKDVMLPCLSNNELSKLHIEHNKYKNYNKLENDINCKYNRNTKEEMEYDNQIVDLKNDINVINRDVLEESASPETDKSSDIAHFINEEHVENEQIISLENTISQLKREINALKNALCEKDEVKKIIESKMNMFMKQLETITAERDTVVVRYAVSERNALEANKAKESAISSEQNAKREVSMITQRLRTANAERTRATAALDIKCHELSQSQKELSRLKDELQSCDVKLKWAQSKLMSEMDAHKESSSLVEKLTFQIKQIEFGGSGSVSLSQPTDIDSLLREKDATIILEKHERERFETRCKTLQQEVDQLKSTLNSTTKDVRELRAQIEAGSAESAALRRACAELRDQGAKDCERLAAAQARAARCDTLATHLQQEQDRSVKLMKELEIMSNLRDEALAEGELRARREAELLRQAERLTAAGVKLQASCSEAESKALALSVDNVSLKETTNRAVLEAKELRIELIAQQEGRAADAKALAALAAQHARGERDALTALEAARGEIRILSTKHASALKELKRELLQAKKKYEKYENECKLLSCPPTSKSSEKTGSTSSLSSYEGQGQQGESITSLDQENQVPDNQRLIQRIASLQKAIEKQNERMEFLEEHNRYLTHELQQKTRLLRSLLMASPSGGLTSPASDAAKIEIGKYGSIMSSVYGSQVTDETMTLELSLEINAKLQSLLEDTLLSNITLKENMDTLGDEISRLKEERRVVKDRKKS